MYLPLDFKTLIYLLEIYNKKFLDLRFVSLLHNLLILRTYLKIIYLFRHNARTDIFCLTFSEVSVTEHQMKNENSI